MSGTLENPLTGKPLEASAGPLHRPRILLVSRRLWPLVGETEMGLLQLATDLRDAGALPTLLTVRWETQWAERSTLRGIPIVRLPWPTTPGWGVVRYLYALSRYLRRNHSQFDAVVVSGLRAEAFCALASLPKGGSPSNGPPVILRVSEAGTYGEVAWQQQARFGKRIAAKCQGASAFLASSPFVAAELQQAGYPSERVQVLPTSLAEFPIPRNEASRLAARRSLAAVNHDLEVTSSGQVALCLSLLQPGRGLETLIEAWVPIRHRWPHAKLWIVGDGPERDKLWRLISDLDLRYRVLIPGSFDDWSDLMQAADVLVAPAPQPAQSSVLRTALAAGLPVVATHQPEHAELIVDGQTGLLYEAGNRNSLVLAMTRLLNLPEFAALLGAAARRKSEQQSKKQESRWLLERVATHRDPRGC
jgi:glycosyltransferase involved in cell wall biosynthesis